MATFSTTPQQWPRWRAPFASFCKPAAAWGNDGLGSRHSRGPCWGGAWRPRALPAACPDLALCRWDYGILAMARVGGAGGGRSSSGAPGGGGPRPLVTCSRSPSWLAATGGAANAGNERPRSGPGTGSCWWGDLHAPLPQPAVRSLWHPPPAPRAPRRLVLLCLRRLPSGSPPQRGRLCPRARRRPARVCAGANGGPELFSWGDLGWADGVCR